jgi:CHASE3 domain sensor protein
LSKEYQEESDLSQDLQEELHHHTTQGQIHRTLDKAQPNNIEEEKEAEEAITMQGRL